MKVKFSTIVIAIILLTILGFGVEGALNLLSYFSKDTSNSTPVFRHSLSVPREDKYDQCASDIELPENAFWYGGSKCHWECLSSYEKDDQTCLSIEMHIILFLQIFKSNRGSQGLQLIDDIPSTRLKEFLRKEWHEHLEELEVIKHRCYSGLN